MRFRGGVCGLGQNNKNNRKPFVFAFGNGNPHRITCPLRGGTRNLFLSHCSRSAPALLDRCWTAAGPLRTTADGLQNRSIVRGAEKFFEVQQDIGVKEILPHPPIMDEALGDAALADPTIGALLVEAKVRGDLFGREPFFKRDFRQCRMFSVDSKSRIHFSRLARTVP